MRFIPGKLSTNLLLWYKNLCKQLHRCVDHFNLVSLHSSPYHHYRHQKNLHRDYESRIVVFPVSRAESNSDFSPKTSKKKLLPKRPLKKMSYLWMNVLLFIMCSRRCRCPYLHVVRFKYVTLFMGNCRFVGH